MKKRLSKKQVTKKFDCTHPTTLSISEKILPTYDELVSQGMGFVKEDIIILGEQLEILEDTSNQFLDCLHIDDPDNGKLYDKHRKSTFLILEKIKNIREIVDYMKSNLKTTIQ